MATRVNVLINKRVNDYTAFFHPISLKIAIFLTPCREIALIFIN